MARRSCVVVGFDPDPATLPPSFGPRNAARPAEPDWLERAIERVGEGLLDACAPYVVGVKFQFAHFLAAGGQGFRVLRRLIECARSLGLFTIVDAKSGDIDATARAYAWALIGAAGSGASRGCDETLGADACTLQPYLGTDSVAPFLEWVDAAARGVFVVVHTSNPSAPEIQHLRLEDGRTVAEAVADRVAAWAGGRRGTSGYASVGAVVGATYPDRLGALRRRLPGVWFLLPGVGAQGGTAAALAAAFDGKGLGGLVTASRSILGAWQRAPGGPGSWKEAARESARLLREESNRVRTVG